MKTQFNGKEIIRFQPRSLHGFDRPCPSRCNAILSGNDILKVSQALN
jgi:hypothetical protein